MAREQGIRASAGLFKSNSSSLSKISLGLDHELNFAI